MTIGRQCPIWPEYDHDNSGAYRSGFTASNAGVRLPQVSFKTSICLSTGRPILEYNQAPTHPKLRKNSMY